MMNLFDKFSFRYFFTFRSLTENIQYAWQQEDIESLVSSIL